MPYQILPAEPSDIPEIAIIHHEAFKDDEILGRLMCDVKPARKNAYDEAFYNKAFAQKHLTGAVFHKVVDTDTGKIVACARWKYPYALTSAQVAEKEQLDLTRSYPEGTNAVLYDEFFAELDAKRKMYCDEEKDYFLHILAVSPAHQRRGLGSMLIEKGLREANKDDARVYIEASVKGLQLYKKYGWREIDRIELDMTPHGGDGVAVEELLMREPRATLIT